MPERPAVTGRFVLDLDGVISGFLKTVDGGAISADVIREPGSATPFVKKHLGRPKYEDLTLEMGLGMHAAVYDWIAESWKGSTQRKNGAVISADFNNEVRTIQEFGNAAITETSVPACDAASREAAYLTVKLAPQMIRTRKGGGKVVVPAPNAQKMWLPSNFRLEIGGLDCSRVMKVDAFTVKQQLASRDPREPTRLEFPNLRITLPAVSTPTWDAWFEDFVVKGNCSDTYEKNGKLAFLSPNLGEELASVLLFNVGIFRFAPERSPSSDQLERWIADLYCERMEFHA